MNKGELRVDGQRSDMVLLFMCFHVHIFSHVFHSNTPHFSTLEYFCDFDWLFIEIFVWCPVYTTTPVMKWWVVEWWV